MRGEQVLMRGEHKYYVYKLYVGRKAEALTATRTNQGCRKDTNLKIDG